MSGFSGAFIQCSWARVIVIGIQNILQPKGCKNFPYEVRETVSHDKPKKRAYASRDIAKECVMNVLLSPPSPPSRLPP